MGNSEYAERKIPTGKMPSGRAPQRFARQWKGGRASRLSSTDRFGGFSLALTERQEGIMMEETGGGILILANVGGVLYPV